MRELCHTEVGMERERCIHGYRCNTRTHRLIVVRYPLLLSLFCATTLLVLMQARPSGWLVDLELALLWLAGWLAPARSLVRSLFARPPQRKREKKFDRVKSSSDGLFRLISSVLATFN